MNRQSMLVLSLAVGVTACARGSNAGAGDTSAPDTSAVASEPVVLTADTAGPASSPPAGGGAGAPSGAAPRQGRIASPRPPATPAGGAPSTPSSSAASDTARGRVAVVGATPITQVVLRPSSGQSITLTGRLADEIRAASGAEVWVRGRRVGSREFEVASYAVRAVDGVPAVTGTLRLDGDRLVLVSDDERRHVIANPPSSLHELVGGRVWVSGDLTTGITAYGVLRRPR